MSTNLDGIVAKIREVRKQKRPEIDARLHIISPLCEAVKKTEEMTNAVAASDADFTTALHGIRFGEVIQSLKDAERKLERAHDRLTRDGVNIGVAGRARQGKSQILQMLTGLSDKQIPTGAHGFCTATQSEITNSSRLSAKVHYMTGPEFLQKQILYAYQPRGAVDGALGLSPAPSSVSAFRASTIPPLPPDSESLDKVHWKHLLQLQQELTDDLVSKLDSGAVEIENIADLRKFLTKDDGDKLHYVIDHVSIEVPFPVALPLGVKVFDLPGLRDPAPGIINTMLTNLREKADIVLLLRRPDPAGDDWGQDDHDICKLINSIYKGEGIEPKDWVQLVMNEDLRPGSNNSENVAAMSKTALAEVELQPAKCNCADPSSVQQMIDGNIRALVEKVSVIDDLRIRQANEAFRKALAEIEKLLEKLARQRANLLASQPDLKKLLKTLTRQFRGDLRTAFDETEKKMGEVFQARTVAVLLEAFTEAEKALNQMYLEHGNDDVFPDDFPAFSKKRILEEFRQASGPGEAENISVRNQREAVLKLLRTKLATCCQSLVDGYFDCVVKMAFDLKPLCQISPHYTDGTERPLARIERFLAELRKSENGLYVTLDDAVSDLRQFHLTFDNTILPAIYQIQDINDFNPTIRGGDLDVNLKAYNASLGESAEDKKKKADTTFNWLKQKSQSIVNKVTSGSDDSPLTIIANYIANMMRANFDSFGFRFIWGDDCDDDWNRFIDENKHKLWPKEFEEALANSKRAQQWNDALKPLSDALEQAKAIDAQQQAV